MGKKTKDLEQELLELREKVVFYESWLKGEAKPAVSEETQQEINRLETELKILSDEKNAALKKSEDKISELEAELNLSEILRNQYSDVLKRYEKDFENLESMINSGARRWYYLSDQNPKFPKVNEDVLVCCADMRSYVEGIMSNDKRIQFGTLATNSRWTGKEWLNVPPGCIVAAWQKFSSIPRMTRMEEYVITTFAETLNEKEEFKRMLNAIYNLASNRRATKQLYDVWERCKKNFEQYKHAHRLHDRSAVIAADVLTFKKGVENDVR